MFDKLRCHAVLGGALAVLLAAAPAHARRGAPAELAVENTRTEPVAVFVDGIFLQRIDPGEPFVLRLRPGAHEVRVVDAQGQTIEQRHEVLEPHGRLALVVEPSMGELAVESRSTVPLVVHVRGQGEQRAVRRSLAVAPGRHRDVALAPGTYELEVQARWFNRSTTISRRRVVIESGETDSLRLRTPRTALVQVHNPAPVDAELTLLDGARERGLGAVPAGQTAHLMVPVGTAHLALVADGRVLDADELRVDARTGGRFEAQVPMGEVELENEGPVGVFVVLDGASVGTVGSGRELELTVLAGPHQLRVVAQDGRLVMDERIWVDSGEELDLVLGRARGRQSDGHRGRHPGHHGKHGRKVGHHH